MRAASRALGLAVFALLAAGPLSAQSATDLRLPSVPAFQAGLGAASATIDRVSAVGYAGDDLSPFQEARRNRGKGALWGAGLGLVAGGLLGGLTAGSEDDDDGFGEGLVESAATGEAVILGAVVGAALGAVLGATVFAPARGGSSAAAAPLAIRLAPHHEGDKAGVRVGLRWLR